EDDPDYAGYPESCNLEISGLSFPLADWRELAGKVSEVVFAADDVHPILRRAGGFRQGEAVGREPEEVTGRGAFGRLQESSRSQATKAMRRCSSAPALLARSRWSGSRGPGVPPVPGQA